MAYRSMISDAIIADKNRKGTSLHVIKSFIMQNHPELGLQKHHLLASLKKGVENGYFIKNKGSYKLSVPPKKSNAEAQDKIDNNNDSNAFSRSQLSSNSKKSNKSKNANPAAISKNGEEPLVMRVEVISTYQDKDQEFTMHNLPFTLSADDIAIEKDWVVEICSSLDDPSDLVKLSLCCMGLNSGKATKAINQKIKSVCSRCDLKYYFQPNQREEVENHVVKKVKGVAKNTDPC